MKLALIVAIVCLVAGFLLRILSKILYTTSALSSMEALQNGESAKLSIAQIASLNVNLPDAEKNLTKEEFNRVYELYRFYQKQRIMVEYTPVTYAIQAAKIVVSFDKVAPYVEYSGEPNPITAKIKLETSYDILHDT